MTKHAKTSGQARPGSRLFWKLHQSITHAQLVDRLRNRNQLAVQARLLGAAMPALAVGITGGVDVAAVADV